jgi:short-subunit dehydrogenase
MRPLKQQTVVITGASSGIGREAALEFSRRGAQVVLAARNESSLKEVAAAIEGEGGTAHVVLTDVSEWDQVRNLARATVERFGRIDTWVNDAAVGTYANFEDLTVEEIDRILRVDLLGSIYGAKAALGQMRQQGEGTIINVASALAQRSLPFQSMYCAAKHGMKGFTESLRLELDRDRSGIRVTLILPASINTPFYGHARSKLGVRPRPFPPVYQPQAVAEAIVFAAQHSRREIYVGGAGKLLALLERISPSLGDWYMLQADRGARNQTSQQPDAGQDNLFTPAAEPSRSEGAFGHAALASSLYTRLLEYHPHRKLWLLAAAFAGTGFIMRGLTRRA